MTEHNSPTKVVVIGGGYAGTMAANHLRTGADPEITLVNPRQEFVERIRLHQFAAGTGTATIDYDTMLGDGVRLVVDSATCIDAAGRTVRLGSGRTLAYDYLVYAVGSTGAAPAVIAHNGEKLEGVFLVEIVDGLITDFYVMRNPDKLVALRTPRRISR